MMTIKVDRNTIRKLATRGHCVGFNLVKMNSNYEAIVRTYDGRLLVVRS